jgi:hypothetical protein
MYCILAQAAQQKLQELERENDDIKMQLALLKEGGAAVPSVQSQGVQCDLGRCWQRDQLRCDCLPCIVSSQAAQPPLQTNKARQVL